MAAQAHIARQMTKAGGRPLTATCQLERPPSPGASSRPSPAATTPQPGCCSSPSPVRNSRGASTMRKSHLSLPTPRRRYVGPPCMPTSTRIAKSLSSDSISARRRGGVLMPGHAPSSAPKSAADATRNSRCWLSSNRTRQSHSSESLRSREEKCACTRSATARTGRAPARPRPALASRTCPNPSASARRQPDTQLRRTSPHRAAR